MDSICDSIQHDGRDHHCDAGEQQHWIALGVDEVIPDDADNEGQANTDRKCHSESRNRHGSDYQDIRDAVYDSAEKTEGYILRTSVRKIIEEGAPVRSH